jgi:hypothetical protein
MDPEDVHTAIDDLAARVSRLEGSTLWDCPLEVIAAELQRRGRLPPMPGAHGRTRLFIWSEIDQIKAERRASLSDQDMIHELKRRGMLVPIPGAPGQYGLIHTDPAELLAATGQAPPPQGTQETP